MRLPGAAAESVSVGSRRSANPTSKDERDEAVGVLRGLDPAEPGRLQEMAPHVTRLLMEFIQKV